MFCIINSELEIYELSPSLHQQIGGIQIQNYGVKLSEIIHPEDWPHVCQVMGDKNRYDKKFECRVLNEKSVFKWFEWDVKWVERDQKFLVHLKLRENEQTATKLLNHISATHQIGIWEIEVENKKMNWCEKAADICGVQSLDESNCPSIVLNFFDQDSVLRISQAVRKVVKQQEEIEIELTLTIGKWIKVTAKPLVNNGTTTHIVGTIQDITNEIRKAEIIFKNNIELSAIEKGLEQFSIVARTDAKGKIIYANEKFCQLSQYTHEEIIGKDHRILNSGYHSKDFWRRMWEQVSKGKSWRGEVRNKAKDGSYYWVDTVIVPIFDAQGELAEILSVRYDITEHKSLIGKVAEELLAQS
jgi:PAS domain S-box-containing protein